jgi:hypothetical protein
MLTTVGAHFLCSNLWFQTETENTTSSEIYIAMTTTSDNRLRKNFEYRSLLWLISSRTSQKQPDVKNHLVPISA